MMPRKLVIPLGYWQDEAEQLARQREEVGQARHSMGTIVWLMIGWLLTAACGCGFLLGLAGQRLVSWLLNY